MIKKPWHLTNEMYDYSRLENRTLDDLMKINPTVVLNVLKNKFIWNQISETSDRLQFFKVF